MNSLTDSSTRRPDRGANTRASASLQLYADKVRDSGKKAVFQCPSLQHGTILHLGHVTSVLYCARNMSTSSVAVKYC